MIRRNTKFIFFGFICVFSAFLFSCCSTGNDLFAYSKESFTAEIEGSVDGISVKATAYVEKKEGESQERIMTVRYHYPESLEGLVISIYPDGNVKSRLGEITLNDGAFYGLASPFLSICPDGEFSSVSYDGEGNATVIFSDNKKNLKYHFENGTSLPKKIEGVISGRQILLHIRKK